MITRHHLALALLTGGILCTALHGAEGSFLIMLLTGICLGAILPDIHMKRPSTIRPQTLAWCIVWIGRAAIVAILCRVYKILLGIRTNTADKRLTHSVPGIILFSLIFTVSLYAICCLVHVPGAWPLATGLSVGIFLGMAVHLVHDLCCRKGIMPWYPFSGLVIFGSIRPCDICDPRIARFHVQHVLVLVASQIVLFLNLLPAFVTFSFGLLCASLCLGAMVMQSGARYEIPAVQTPVQEENFSL